MEIESLTEFDLKFLEILRPDGWSDIRPVHAFYLRNEFCYPVKISLNDRPVAIGTAIVHRETGWLAHIIVEKGYRRKGLASKIIEALLQKVVGEEKCRSVSLIATEDGFPVYQKFGFEMECEYLRMSLCEGAEMVGKNDEGDMGAEKNGVIVELKDSHLESMLAVDGIVSGEDREKIVLKSAEGALVYLVDGDVKGFYLPSLGEGLVISLEKVAGLKLLMERLKLKRQVVIPSGNTHCLDFLVNLGFKKDNVVMRRMVLGEILKWRPEAIYSRIGGHLG